MTRLTIELREDESNALRALAQQQRRHLRAQAAILIRQKLQELGLLKDKGDSLKSPDVRMAE